MSSQVKKNESALERIRGYQGEMQIHSRKMKDYRKQKKKKKKKRKRKIERKEKEKLARLKTQKGSLGKN